jgi:sulfur carrier protein ThiS
MQVRVKLLGTLAAYSSRPCPPEGLDLDLPVGSTIETLVEVMGIPRDRVAIATINNVLAKADDPVPDQGVVKLMQRLAGG